MFRFPFSHACRLSKMGMITIRTITTAMSMIQFVEPASFRASSVATTVSACMAGVAVDSCSIPDVRLSARLVNKIAIPSMIQKETRIVCIFIFIVAWMIFKYIIPYSTPKSGPFHGKSQRAIFGLFSREIPESQFLPCCSFDSAKIQRSRLIPAWQGI